MSSDVTPDVVEENGGRGLLPEFSKWIKDLDVDPTTPIPANLLKELYALGYATELIGEVGNKKVGKGHG